MTTKVYTKCPLPFIGQKRHFLKQYRQTLLHVREEVDTIVDLFGGSGLLSHAAKRLMPECRVVYNDYDHYTNRIQHIPQTNELIQHIRQHLQGLKPDARLTPLQRSRVVKLVNEAQKHYGWVDAQTIGRSLLFSGRWVTSVSELKQQATMLRTDTHQQLSNLFCETTRFNRADKPGEAEQQKLRTLFGSDRRGNQSSTLFKPYPVST